MLHRRHLVIASLLACLGLLLAAAMPKGVLCCISDDGAVTLVVEAHHGGDDDHPCTDIPLAGDDLGLLLALTVEIPAAPASQAAPLSVDRRHPERHVQVARPPPAPPPDPRPLQRIAFLV